jgi:hypothetical protein
LGRLALVCRPGLTANAHGPWRVPARHAVASGEQWRWGMHRCEREAGAAHLSRGLGDSGLGRAALGSALPPLGPGLSHESRRSAPTARFSASISSTSSFPQPARSHNRFRLARVPRKEERRRGETRELTFQGGRPEIEGGVLRRGQPPPPSSMKPPPPRGSAGTEGGGLQGSA